MQKQSQTRIASGTFHLELLNPRLCIDRRTGDTWRLVQPQPAEHQELVAQGYLLFESTKDNARLWWVTT
jgi:hypothetical protein